MSSIVAKEEARGLVKLKLELAEKKKRVAASQDLLSFVRYTMPNYEAQEFHVETCKILDAFVEGVLKKVMIFIPPQHGKSQISSRHLPSYLLGKNPKEKIALCSYGASHAQSFNRDVQRIIDDERYNEVFPDTILSKSKLNPSQGNYKRTSDVFETVGHKGFLKSVGVNGALTGTTVDTGIIDDVYKDKEEAYSQTVREKVWNWYNHVFAARLHNDSKQLILFTRWHNDDLAARLIKQDGTDFENNGWFVVTYRGIKEDGDDSLNPFVKDTRNVGDALWESKHSAKRLLAVKRNDPMAFASIYQQRPMLTGGNMVQQSWFKYYNKYDMMNKDVYNHTYIDTALSEKDKKNNDPTGILTWFTYDNDLYLVNFSKGHWGFPELIDNIEMINKQLCNDPRSVNYIENKQNGASTKQQLVKTTKLNVKLENIKGDKVQRLSLQTSRIMAGRVYLPSGEGWTIDFVNQICGFPAMKHDEEVDCLTGAMRIAFEDTIKQSGGGIVAVGEVDRTLYPDDLDINNIEGWIDYSDGLSH